MRTLLALGAICLLIGGCGGDEETAPVAGSTQTTPAAGPATEQLPDGVRPDGTVPMGNPLRGAEASFAELQAELGGRIGISAAPVGELDPIVLGDLTTGVAWSTMKVPVLVALIREVGGVEKLSGDELASAKAAITASDNDAAQALFDRLAELTGGGVEGASSAVEDLLRYAGDSKTVVNTEESPEGYSTFGQTEWSAEAATIFFSSLAACLLTPEDADYVRGLMEGVVEDQDWGLGQLSLDSTAFKGGWGPGPDGTYLVRQSGTIRDGVGALTVTILAEADPAAGDTFAAGTEMVSAVAQWLVEQGPLPGAPTFDCDPGY